MKSARVSLLLVLTFWIAVVGLRNLSATIRTVEMRLTLRTWIHPFKNSSEWTPAAFEQTIPSNQTAIIICDMWDKHWCSGATTRVEGLARRMEPLLEQARAKSILIIHAPSETMSYYANARGGCSRNARSRSILQPRLFRSRTNRHCPSMIVTAAARHPA